MESLGAQKINLKRSSVLNAKCMYFSKTMKDFRGVRVRWKCKHPENVFKVHLSMESKMLGFWSIYSSIWLLLIGLIDIDLVDFLHIGWVPSYWSDGYSLRGRMREEEQHECTHFEGGRRRRRSTGCIQNENPPSRRAVVNKKNLEYAARHNTLIMHL